MANKYPGYNEDDTFWDDFHRKRGMMTNREFFTSNGPGGFYEGMEWDGGEWVPDAKTRARQYEEESRRCPECECESCQCW